MKIPKSIFNPVHIVPAGDIIKGHSFNPRHTHFVVVDTPDGKVIVNSCSKDYTLVDNKKLLDPFIKFFREGGYDVEWNVSIRNDAVFYIDAIFKNSSVVIHKKSGDLVFPKLRINNSYDGSVRYSESLGFYRQVCSNGLTVPDGPMTTISKKKHTRQVMEITTEASIFERVTQFINQSGDYVIGYQTLQEQKVASLEDRIQEIIELTKFPTRQAEAVLERAIYERDQLKVPQNDWLVYNAFNYQLNHNEEISRADHKKDQIDLEVLNFLLGK